MHSMCKSLAHGEQLVPSFHGVLMPADLPELRTTTSYWFIIDPYLKHA